MIKRLICRLFGHKYPDWISPHRDNLCKRCGNNLDGEIDWENF